MRFVLGLGFYGGLIITRASYSCFSDFRRGFGKVQLSFRLFIAGCAEMFVVLKGLI